MGTVPAPHPPSPGAAGPSLSRRAPESPSPASPAPRSATVGEPVREGGTTRDRDGCGAPALPLGQGNERVSQATSPFSSVERRSRANPSFSSTRSDGVFQVPTVDQSRFRPVAAAALTTAPAASVA